MKLKSVLSEILEIKELSEYLTKIAKSNIKTQKSLLQSLTTLSYILYIKKDKKYLDIIKILSQVEFENNYDYWTWIEFSIVLFAYTLKPIDKKKFEKLIFILENSLNQGSELAQKVNKNVHKRFLTGATLDKTDIVKYKNNGNILLEMNSRIIFLMKLLKLSIYGEKSSVDKEFLNSEIKDNLTILYKYIQEDGLEGLFPFKKI